MRRRLARLALAVPVLAVSVLAVAASGLVGAGPAAAQTRVTLKSATASSSYYVMMVQLGEVLRAASLHHAAQPAGRRARRQEALRGREGL